MTSYNNFIENLQKKQDSFLQVLQFRYSYESDFRQVPLTVFNATAKFVSKNIAVFGSHNTFCVTQYVLHK